MKNPLPTFSDEVLTLYRNPRDIHRVLMIVPLGAMLSHIHYLYAKMLPIPLTKDEIISLSLAGVLFALVLFWCFLSGKMHSTLWWRFAFMGGWSGLCHRMVVYGNEFAGVSLYAFIFAWGCMLAIGFFALTGKTKRDFDQLFEEYTAKKNEAQNLKLVDTHSRSVG